MKILVSILCSCALLGSVGCGGGGSKDNITQVQTKDQKTIVLGVKVTATGSQDPLDSVILASAGAGCSITKARTPITPRIAYSEGKCGETAIKFSYNADANNLIMECDLALGVPGCKAQFTKVLGMARDAHYIQ